MPQASSLIRRYSSHDAYEHDIIRLARLGYVTVSVVEEPAPPYWVALIGRVFGSTPQRLTVIYSDAGTTPR
jgi:hypothetical protein